VRQLPGRWKLLALSSEGWETELPMELALLWQIFAGAAPVVATPRRLSAVAPACNPTSNVALTAGDNNINHLLALFGPRCDLAGSGLGSAREPQNANASIAQ
jgi:hypothetical protein